MNIWMIGKNSTKHHYLKHEKFYSHVNIEEMTNADYTHAERVCKNFEIKIQQTILICLLKVIRYLIADVFGKFRNICFEIYELGPAKYLAVSGLAWKIASKNTKVRLDLLNHIDMLLMENKEYVTLFINMQKLIINT